MNYKAIGETPESKSLGNTFNLSQLEADKHITLLLYGESGVGKSVAAASFPGPFKWFDFDRKISSVASYFKDQPQILNQIEVWQPKVGISGDAMPDFFEETRKIDSLIACGKPLPFNTLVIDTLTTFSAAMLNHIVKTNPGFKRQAVKQENAATCQQDYGVLKKVFVQTIPGLLTLPCNVIFLGHIRTQQNEKTGEITRQTNMDGSFAGEIPSLMEEVYRIYMKDGKRCVQTEADNRYFCRTQRRVTNGANVSEGLYKQIIN